MLVFDEDKTLNNLANVLSDVGIQVKDNSGNYRNLDDIIEDITNVFDKIDRKQQTYLLFSIKECTEYRYVSAEEIRSSIRKALKVLRRE